MVALLCFTLMATPAPNAGCVPTTYAALLERLQGNPSVRLVFFSSWCVACQRHLRPVGTTPMWVVGAFDTPERIARVLEHLALDVPCMMASEDLMKRLEIHRVPSVFTYRDGELFRDTPSPP